MKFVAVLCALVVLLFVSNSYQQQTLCLRYSAALNLTQEATIATVVNRTVGALVADPITLPFFNGSIPANSTNYLTNATALETLQEELVQYFGEALGCNETDAYTGRDMATIHEDLEITRAAFFAFNQKVVGTIQAVQVALALNATEANQDATAVWEVLMSLAPAICFDESCTGSPYPVIAGISNYFTGVGSLNRFTPPTWNDLEDGAELDFTQANGVHNVRQGTGYGICTAETDGFSADFTDGELTLVATCPEDIDDGEVIADFYCGVGTHCSSGGMFGSFSLNCENQDTSSDGGEGANTDTSTTASTTADSTTSSTTDGNEDEDEDEDENDDGDETDAGNLLRTAFGLNLILLLLKFLF